MHKLTDAMSKNTAARQKKAQGIEEEGIMMPRQSTWQRRTSTGDNQQNAFRRLDPQRLPIAKNSELHFRITSSSVTVLQAFQCFRLLLIDSL
eukprot:2548498-Amphidinium_carterae.1